MKRLKSPYCLFFIFLIALGCSSNDDEPTPVKSSNKAITSFNFTSPNVSATITDTDKKISATVPNGSPVTSLVPTLVISEKATVSPASGLAQNFTSPVAYTVTAEDGTKQIYTVTVTVSDEVSFTLEAAAYTDLEQDGAILIHGTNFGTVEQTKLVLTDVSNGNTTTLQATTILESKAIIAKVPADLAIGSYKVRVFKALESKEMAEIFTVEKHSPDITGPDKTTVARGQNIVISGDYFQNTGNVVTLTKGSKKVICTIVNESTESIEVTVPSSTEVGEYTLSVKSNGKETFYNTTSIVVELPANYPVIDSIDKSSYKLGQTITITGKNLRKIGFAANINFVPFTSGVTQVRSGIASTDGTTVTFVIPDNFATGTYIVSIEIDGDFTNEYNEVIEITN